MRRSPSETGWDRNEDEWDIFLLRHGKEKSVPKCTHRKEERKKKDLPEIEQ